MFKFRPVIDRDSIRAARPKAGDRVLYEGQVCTVLAYGLRYVRLDSPEHGQILVKQTDIRRCDIEADTASPFDEFSGPTTFDHNNLLRPKQETTEMKRY